MEFFHLFFVNESSRRGDAFAGTSLLFPVVLNLSLVVQLARSTRPPWRCGVQDVERSFPFPSTTGFVPSLATLDQGGDDGYRLSQSAIDARPVYVLQ